MTIIHAETSAPLIKYPPAIESALARLVTHLYSIPRLTRDYPPRWLAIQLLERDDKILALVRHTPDGDKVLSALEAELSILAELLPDGVDVAMADTRYSLVNNLAHAVVSYSDVPAESFSDRLDRIATHRIFGVPIFLSIMWIVFKITTDVTTPLLDWVDSVISGPITHLVQLLLDALNLSGTWIESLLVDGVIAGVGGVLIFVPVLMSLYVALALLEDSGYMARAAFVMDRFMNVVGLHGKSFVPMVIGFGCTVPAIYATRTLENRRDRILTGLLVPFMSCGARLPVYILFSAIFFPRYAGLVIFGIYLLGIVAALGVGTILQKTLFKREENLSFVMELPPYRTPNLRTVWIYVWSRTSAFLKNASTLILVTSMVVWLLMAIPVTGIGSFANTRVDESAFAAVSGQIARITAPLGFGSWESSGALVTGFVAKEVVISTLSQVHNTDQSTDTVADTRWHEDVLEIATSFGRAAFDTVRSIPLVVGINVFGNSANTGDTALMSAIRRDFTATSGGHAALAGLAYMIFVLLYTPCVATVAAERHELGVRWMWFSIVGQTSLAWLVTLAVFQLGKLMGF